MQRTWLVKAQNGFLQNPVESLVKNVAGDTKLAAKVHIQPGQQLELCKLLVSRRICTWVHCDDVLKVNGRKVLNGLFGVGKQTFLPSGEEIQRVIMNLIPSNSVFMQLGGAVADLPGITQFLSLSLEAL